ncbi:2-keto-4-pentenoate hydratase/2-oxohepta-3-ene-1,7-dioic acid hydratase [Burkholderia sp. Ch1-1]|uniref:2-keto-4-pentenoate hydratase/2-oxohepta-3-ene-1,7-dioic acid hydratase n=1 Tax=Paraburkholderia dioscoreae TaxID=2604047 RepID=A0A5Q4ZAW9_9BURK|nr:MULTISPECIES: fumarylacetoacetate hydrolase family protein [Paraburkholderia]EIF31660.1 2-keto-4-pentenoate hydratase/2-oxohepta-3-ene-1,7-dioic acid hydratase [Burkholderia sp. Ch1-1]MDR8398020.1 fumarylacetoacetate hydrolase family protein [Paraburkholderia sp. USG1]VVD28061.1 2-keto-4-pentenoate hydratase/2-oxohepta-3-ene-1,7-dioic acid hydratase [Paraburkholderia dioscoreae]
MKLVSFHTPDAPGARVGALVESARALPGAGASVVDLSLAYAAWRRDVEHDPFADDLARIRIPADMKRFLEGGGHSMRAARHALRHVHALAQSPDNTVLARSGILRPLAAVRLLAPLQRPGKIIAIGANYSGHIQEGRDAGVLRELPQYPVAFLKMPSAVIGPDEAITRSRHTEELDYEIELSMVIGQRCRDLSADNWREAVAGFTIVNDISMRDLIVVEKPTGVVFQGKNLDTTCPLGPCIVTCDELADPDALNIALRVNGETRQHDNTRQMIFKCGEILAYWSSRLTLEPGDIVTTGTTSGVAGFNRRFPERLLKHGDVIEAEIEGIGILRNTVVDER